MGCGCKGAEGAVPVAGGSCGGCTLGNSYSLQLWAESILIGLSPAHFPTLAGHTDGHSFPCERPFSAGAGNSWQLSSLTGLSLSRATPCSLPPGTCSVAPLLPFRISGPVWPLETFSIPGSVSNASFRFFAWSWPFPKSLSLGGLRFFFFLLGAQVK